MDKIFVGASKILVLKSFRSYSYVPSSIENLILPYVNIHVHACVATVAFYT